MKLRGRRRKETAFAWAIRFDINMTFTARRNYSDLEDHVNERRRRSDVYCVPKDKSWIPNWENKDFYLNLVNQDSQKVAWEFLRRNYKYQCACDDLEDFCHARDILMELSESDKAMGISPFKNVSRVRTWCIPVFGVEAINPYAGDNAPRFCVANIIYTYRHDENGGWGGHYTGREVSEHLSNGDVVAYFDLNYGIEGQIKKFKKELEAIKKRHNIEQLNYTSLAAKERLIQYLRLLDIHATTNNKDYMNEVVGSRGYNGKYTAANVAIESALKMARTGYKSLLLTD